MTSTNSSEHMRHYIRSILAVTFATVCLLAYSTISAAPLEQYGASSSLHIALNEQNASGQSGWVKLTAIGVDTEIILSLSEGTLATDIVDIHEGQCGSTVRQAAYALNNLSDGESSTVLEGISLESLLTGDFTIIGHHIDSTSLHTAVHTFCGNLPLNSDTLTMPLDQLNASAQFGWATLTDRGEDTEVVVSLSAGNMVSKFVHIHTGQCGATLGGVTYGLTDFTDRVSVSLLEDVSLSSLLTGGFAINAHNITYPAIYTACGNVPAQTKVEVGSTSDFTSLDGVVEIHVPATAPVGMGTIRYVPKTIVDFPSPPVGLNYGSTLFEIRICKTSAILDTF